METIHEMPRCSRLVGAADSGCNEEDRDSGGQNLFSAVGVAPADQMQHNCYVPATSGQLRAACLPDHGSPADDDTQQLRSGSAGSASANTWSTSYSSRQGSLRLESTLAEQLDSEKSQRGSHEAYRKSMPELNVYSGAPNSENMQEDSGKETWKSSDQRADAMKKAQSALREHWGRRGSSCQRWPDIAADDQRQSCSSWIPVPAEADSLSSVRMNNRSINRRSGVNHWSISDPSFLQEKEFLSRWPESPQVAAAAAGKSCSEDQERKLAGLDAWRASSLPRAMSVKEGNQRSWGCNMSSDSQEAGCDARRARMFDRLSAAAMEPAHDQAPGNQSRNSMQETNLGAMWLDTMQRRTSASRPPPPPSPLPQMIPQVMGPKKFVQKSGSPLTSVGTQSAARSRWEKLLKHHSKHQGEEEIASVQNSHSLRHDDGGIVGSAVFEGRSFPRRGKQMSFDADDALRRRPRSMMQKANSMREGGAHSDAVSEMAQAYNGIEKHRILECALCGRGLGVVMQGSLQVGMSFCQTCQPSPIGWRKCQTTSSSDQAAPKKQQKKKQGILQFCRKMLRLDKKQGLSI